MKPPSAQWMIKLQDYLIEKPEIIQNGFNKGAGILNYLQTSLSCRGKYVSEIDAHEVAKAGVTYKY